MIDALEVYSRFRSGQDTAKIARFMGCKEHEVANRMDEGRERFKLRNARELMPNDPTGPRLVAVPDGQWELK